MSLLIVDDHASFRSSARALLEAEGCHVVGEAEDGAAALRESGRLHPDVVLLDVQLPDRSGFEIAADLRALPGPPAVVLVSSRRAEEYGECVADAPVSGFIHKPDLSRAELETIVGPLV